MSATTRVVLRGTEEQGYRTERQLACRESGRVLTMRGKGTGATEMRIGPLTAKRWVAHLAEAAKNLPAARPLPPL